MNEPLSGCTMSRYLVRFGSIMKHRQQTIFLVTFSLLLLLLFSACAPVPSSTSVSTTPVPQTTPVASNLTATIHTQLPLNPHAELAPIDFSKADDMSFPSIEGVEQEKAYLSLHQALYCIQYARSLLPKDSENALAVNETFVEASAVTTTAFGDGKPTNVWQNNRTGQPFANGEQRPAWNIQLMNLRRDSFVTELFLVDAQTGDVYNDTKSGGYYPSPYTDLSAYGAINATPLSAGELTEEIAKEILIQLNSDLWVSQYKMKIVDTLPEYIQENETNRFVIDWGNERIRRSQKDQGLLITSNPKVTELKITSMQTQGEKVVVTYQVYTEYAVADNTVGGSGSDGRAVFVWLDGMWVIEDIGQFPWGMSEYYTAYDQRFN